VRFQNQKRILKRQCVGGKSIYFCIFSFFLILSAYIVFIRHDRSLVWYIDGVGQYYPTFLYIGKYLRTFLAGLSQGIFSMPAFDLSIGMGEDIIGTLNYYGFGNPVNLIAVFATSSNGAQLFTLSYFLRLFLAAMAFRYFCRQFSSDPFYSDIGALIYIFSGFAMIGGAKYIEWLSVLIYFPLILAGCEKLIKGQGG